jgi:HSP20 family protein
MNLIPWRSKHYDEDDFNGGMTTVLSTLRSEMDRMFGRFLGGTWSDPTGAFATYLPSIDVAETENEITVRAEVPGVDPKDVNVTLSGQLLTIAGEKKETSERKGENYFHSERRFGSFRRCIQLPTPVNPDKMTAEHKNGVIQIRLQKQPGAVAKRIPVQTAKE